MDHFISGRATGKQFIGCRSLEELVKNLATPRKVMLMVKAGLAVDALIDQAMLSTSIEESAEYLAQADRIASEAALLFPIYQLPTALIYEGDIVNLRDNPNQLGPLYNVSEWGRSE